MVESTVNLEKYYLEPPEPEAHSGCGSCGSGKSGDRCGNGLEKIYPTTAVRFGYMRHVGEFRHPPEMKFSCGAKVIIQTRRGIEIGEQVSLTCSGCEKSVTRDQMKDWVSTCGHDSLAFDAGRILREATSADLAEYARIQDGNRDQMKTCQRVANQHKLGIKVVECESPFGGERIVFYFTADDRVDFREVVKELTEDYHTRIDMRQIGARDEARLLADFETCGREVCCKVFLKTLRPITMRMAKLQKATLDPTQVSGRCGRLKCCLRYEHTGYEELDKQLPRRGVRLLTNHGVGVVVNRQILTQLVQIQQEDGTRITVVAEDILEVNPKPGAQPPRPEKTPERSSEGSGSGSRGRDGGDQKQSSDRGQGQGRGRGRGRGRRPARGDRPAPNGERPPTGGGDNQGGQGGNAAPTGRAEGSQGNAPEGDAPKKKKRRGKRRRGKRRPPQEGGGSESGGPPPSDG